jgi:predicted DNA-binding transcriptional regulator AlpA
MKIDLELQDIQAIAGQVLDTLKPYLSGTGREKQDDAVLDVPGLSDYLHVSPKWIHERTHLKEIPFIKLSNKQLRFRKREIDKWLDSLRTPAISPLSSRVRLLK